MKGKTNQEDLARYVLSTAFSGSHVEETTGHEPRLSPRDFVFVDAPHRYAVRVLSVGTPRIADVIGRFATAVLHLHGLEGPSDERRLVVVVVSAFGRKMTREVSNFMGQYAPHLSWALIDHRHQLYFEDPHDQRKISTVVEASLETPFFHRAHAGTRTSRLFTDLNAWMLKILLLRRLPERYWSGPCDEIDNPTRLAKVAGVANQTGHSFFKVFEELGFLRYTRAHGVKIVRPRELLDLWLADERQNPAVYTHARSVFGQFEGLPALKRRSEVGLFAVGAFEACARHGVLHTAADNTPTIFTDVDIGLLAWKWDLEFCGRADAQLLLANTRQRESVFRGAVQIDGIPVVDILQAALDVASFPNRGLEQAEFVVERILVNWKP